MDNRSCILKHHIFLADEEVEADAPELDPYEFLEPVDILSKLPKDFYEKVLPFDFFLFCILVLPVCILYMITI